MSIGKYAATAWLALCAGVAIPAEKATEHPDFTGVWTSAPAAPAAAPAAAATPATGAAAPRARATASVPMTPSAKARREAYQKLTAGTDDSPGRWCVGTGMPGSMLGSGGYPMEIHQRPEQIIVVYEAHSEIRRIYLGDRNAPEADRVPGRNGYSSARWEGDTLVVETNNLVDQVDTSWAHSDEATIVERYRLDGKDAQGRRILVAEMTMTDPKFYTAPVKQTKRWAQIPNGRVLPYECPEEYWLQRIEEMAKKAGVPVP
ncbi:MAG: hypothetical protein ABIQ86_00685 [Steroidobacteraceae bacterium]